VVKKIHIYPHDFAIISHFESPLKTHFHWEIMGKIVYYGVNYFVLNNIGIPLVYYHSVVYKIIGINSLSLGSPH